MGQPTKITDRRPAAAPLEFAMCLPILLLLMVSIVWLGFSVVGQSTVAVTARQAAWQQRFAPQDQALLFLTDDFATETSTGSVQVTPLLDDVDPPESSHDVMVDSWDYRGLPLDQPPHWQEYALAAANAKTAGAQILYANARNQFNQWQSAAQNIWQTLTEKLLADLTGLGGMADLLFGDTRNQQANQSAQRSATQQRIDQAQAAVAQAKTRLKTLLDRQREATDESQQRSLEIRSKAQRNKIRRLEAEVRELQSEAEQYPNEE